MLTDRLVVAYWNATQAFELSLPIVPVDPTPLGGANNYAYVPSTYKTPGDFGVLETFAGFGRVWAPYYGADWVLAVKCVWHAIGEDSTQLPLRPIAATIGGTNPAPVPVDPPQRRGFTFTSGLGNPHRIRLFSVPINESGKGRTVTATFGGFDARDRALVAYLSGVETGLVCWDGLPYPPSARVYMRSQRFGGAPAGSSPTDSGGTLASSCLTFPNGAVLCNPSVDLVTLSTPTGQHQWDAAGYTLPDGHRLGVVPA